MYNMVLIPWTENIEELWVASPYVEVDDWLGTLHGYYDGTGEGKDGYIGSIAFEHDEDATAFRLTFNI